MNSGLFLRLILSLTLLFLIGTGFMAYVLLAEAKDSIEESRLQHAHTLAQGLSEGSLDALAIKDYELIERWLLAATPIDEFAYAYLSKSDGIIISHTDAELVARKTDAIGEITAPLVRDITYKNRPVREVVHAAYLGKRHMANAHLAYFLDNKPFYSENIVSNLLGLLLTSLLTLSLATYIILRWALKPIETLADVMHQTTDYLPDLSDKLLKRKDEVGLLARNFDSLMQRLSNSYKELFNEKESTQVTLDSITDAVIVTDESGHVQYMNKVAEYLTGWQLNDALGQPVKDIVLLIDGDSRKHIQNSVYKNIDGSGIVYTSKSRLLISRNNTEHWVQESAASLQNREGKTFGVVLVLTDITELHQVSLNLQHQATHDSLTGLVNRYEFETRLKQALELAHTDGTTSVLCYMDIDQFKVINDTEGHDAGDALLKKFSTHLRQQQPLQGNTTLARLGGDEFGVLLQDCTLDDAYKITQSILQAIDSFVFIWQDKSFSVSCSIGVVPVDKDSRSSIQLFTDADVACYTAKERGRHGVYFYDKDKHEESSHSQDVSNASLLHHAMQQGRLMLYAQPIADLSRADNAIHHYEFLLRMLDENDEVVSAGGLITAAERFGLMQDIDYWVIDNALKQAPQFIAATPKVVISINISGNSFSDSSLTDYVISKLDQYHIEPSSICFEITETAAINNLKQATLFMQQLRKHGCKFSLDDFGSGLSSFTYLKKLEVDYLKIDGAFVEDMLHD
ncbi:MAG: hypothetical protein DRQ44_12915, partial [Gammaproteobacteria bacterium]